MASENSEGSAWTRPNTDNCTLIVGIHSQRVSLSVLQPSGRVLNLHMLHPEIRASPTNALYTIPFTVSLDEPHEFLYGNWAKKYWSQNRNSRSVHLWQLGMALSDDYPLPEDTVIQHSGGQLSILSVELLLSLFLRHLMLLVESLRWDDRQDSFFNLKDRVIFVVPFWMPSLARQRLVNAAKVAGKTATLVNEGTLAASTFFELHHFHPYMNPVNWEQKLLIFVEKSGNVDLYLFLETYGQLEMIGFTGNMHFFPDTLASDDHLELKNELVVVDQRFKKTYNTTGRGTTKGRRKLIWGLLRDLMLRLPRSFRSVYQKPLPTICVGENQAVWEDIIVEECQAYFGTYMILRDDDRMALPVRNGKGGVPRGACSMLWHKKVDYSFLFSQITSKVKELKTYELVAVAKGGTNCLERVDWIRQANGVMVLTLSRGTTKVTIFERNLGTDQNFLIGRLTVSADIYDKYPCLELELKLYSDQGTYSWQGLWEIGAKGNQKAALKLGEDYQWKGVEFTDDEAKNMQEKEVEAVLEYMVSKPRILQKVSNTLNSLDLATRLEADPRHLLELILNTIDEQ